MTDKLNLTGFGIIIIIVNVPVHVLCVISL